MKRIYYPYWEWECFNAGMWSLGTPKDYTPEQCLIAYAEFLRDNERFGVALDRVLKEWPVSCEHFLSNEAINRLAWLGQASMCIATGIPARFRAGFKLLNDAERAAANALAQKALERWIDRHTKKSGPVRPDVAKVWVQRRHPRRRAGRTHGARFGSIVSGDLFGFAAQ